jgi:sugar-specific transcriptional regulator TrmB
MNIDETLRNIGFTAAESKVYLCLLRQGRSRAGKIIKSTSMQSSVIHNTLNTMLEKGFITYIYVSSIKEYSALDPMVISQYIDAKKTAYQNILPALKSMRSPSTFDTAEVYEGYAGILNAMLTLVQDAKKGEVYKYFAASHTILTPEALQFFAKADIIRKENRILLRGIASQDNTQLKAYDYSEIRFTHQSIPPGMNIFHDRVLFMSLGHKPTGILIHSAEIAREYHMLWDALWKSAKKK